MAIASTNPATGETLRVFDPLSESEIEEKLARASEAFKSWRRTSFADRAAAMTRAAGIVESEADHFARLMTLEMGKPLRAARDEALKCATACQYYAENAELLLAEEEVAT